MINLIQRSLRPMLIGVFFIIAIPFVFVTTGPSFFDRRAPVVNLGKIDGSSVTVDQFSEAETAVYTLLTLRYGDRLPETPEVRRQVQQETWQRMLLLASAKKIGINVDDQAVINFIRSMPALQKEGQFQPDRYENMMRFLQRAQGVSEIRFREIIRNQLIVEKMQQLIIGPIQVPATEVAAQFAAIYSPVSLTTATLPLKNFLTQVTATPEEIEQEYKTQVETNPAFRTKEKRRVSYVVYPLSTAEQKLPDAQKEEVRRKISEKALEFALALEPEVDSAGKRPEFAQMAAKFKLNPVTTGFFAEDEAPASLPPSPGLNRAAFALSNERPTSTVIETDNGFYILKLEEIAASQPRPLAEVRGQIEDQIKQRKAFALLQQEGRAAAEKIQSEVAKGVPFRTAAAQLKLTVETIPAFVPGDPKLNNDPKLSLVRRIAMSLKPGQVSSFIPTAAGGVIAQVDSRQAPDRKTYGEAETQLRSQMENQARMIALDDWVRLRSSASGTALPSMLTEKAQQ